MYEIAGPRVRQYLNAEIKFVRSHLIAGMQVLELGCGYGRCLEALTADSVDFFGIDNSLDNLAAFDCRELPGMELAAMNAANLGFGDEAFDLVFAIQNGISAFREKREDLLKEAVRVLRPEGTLLLSTYSQSFWTIRLAWFEQQAAEGLIGKIDLQRTTNGSICCIDGFVSESVPKAELEKLAAGTGCDYRLVEIDESSVFLEIVKSSNRGGGGMGNLRDTSLFL